MVIVKALITIPTRFIMELPPTKFAMRVILAIWRQARMVGFHMARSWLT